jgi:hypothetical protein
MKLPGVMKDEKENLEELKNQIAAERDANYGTKRLTQNNGSPKA